VVLAAVALADGDKSLCAEHLASAKEHAEIAGNGESPLALAIAIIDTQLAWARADSQAVRAAAATGQALLEALPDHGLDTCPEYWVSVLSGLGAALLWSRDHEAATVTLARACRIAELSGHRHTQVNAIGQRALAELISGHRTRARELATAAAVLAEEVDMSAADRPPAAYVTLGWLHAEDGDRDTARLRARQARAATRWLRTDPLSASLLARLNARVLRTGERITRADAEDAVLTVPPALTERFGVTSAAEYRQQATGTHGASTGRSELLQVCEPAASPRNVGPVVLTAVDGGRTRLGAPLSVDPPGPILVEPLTRKEHEVLRHLSAALSTEEVAQTMFVSVNTVRTHIRGILRKLAVSRRNEAIRRARQLRLI
jgi:LuxR family maltose regulon positive regulatory protein